MGDIYTSSRESPHRFILTVEGGSGQIFDPTATPKLSTVARATAIANVPQLQVTTSYRSRDRDSSEVATLTSVLDELGQGSYQTSYDNGHPFKTTEDITSVLGTANISGRGPGGLWYRGLLCPSPNYGTFMTIPDIDLSYGTRAINKTIPTNSIAELATTSAEIFREGLPGGVLAGAGKVARLSSSHSSLKNRIGLLAKAGASDYLNFQFAILPLLGEIGNISEAVIGMNKIISQYLKDSGRQVRRKYTFPSVGSTVDLPKGMRIWDGNINLPSSLVASSSQTGTGYTGNYGRLTVSETTVDTYKFSGAFTYLLSGDDSILGKLDRYSQLANKLYGLRVTPDVLWALTPWSWLVDWVADVGLIIKNASALQQDGLVMKYGYLMRHSVYERTYTSKGYQFALDPPLPASVLRYTRIQKERVKATPYGFGLNPNSFTDRQWSILAALGMTKAPKSLR